MEEEFKHYGEKTKEWTPRVSQRSDGIFQFCLYNNLLKRIEIKTILDVGCCQGRTLKNFYKEYKGALLYGFEPSSENFEQLKINMKDFPDIKLYNVAISDSFGTQKLYLHPTISGHSILLHTGKKVLPEEEVSVIRLDDWASENNVDNFDMVKIDTQGNDFRVITGMGNLVKTVKILKTEVWFCEDGYKNSHLFHEVMSYLHGQGLLLYNFEALTHAKNARLRWGDAIFLRRDILSQIMDLKV